MRKEQDFDRAFWLMRLSYLRCALKTASDPYGLLEHESEALHLSSQFRSLLEKFVPNVMRPVAKGAVYTNRKRKTFFWIV
jgi:hypothetical protein